MENKKEMLLSYIRANVAPILVDFISGNDINGAVVLPANVDVKELNGYYDGADFMPPKWLNEILGTNANKILVIDKIDAIAKEEQLKFCELLEHRKISTFELPKSCVIIVTANEINKDKISISDIEAKEILKQFPLEYVECMESLYSSLKDKEKFSYQLSLLKKKNKLSK